MGLLLFVVKDGTCEGWHSNEWHASCKQGSTPSRGLHPESSAKLAGWVAAAAAYAHLWSSTHSVLGMGFFALAAPSAACANQEALSWRQGHSLLLLLLVVVPSQTAGCILFMLQLCCSSSNERLPCGDVELDNQTQVGSCLYLARFATPLSYGDYRGAERYFFLEQHACWCAFRGCMQP